MSDRALVRERISLADVIEQFDLAVVGRDGKIPCPFHDEDTASFHVYEDHGHCFGCGWDGDVVWFVAQLTGRSPANAVKRLMAAFEGLEDLDGDDLDLRPTGPGSFTPKPVVDLEHKLPPSIMADWHVGHVDYAMERWGLPPAALQYWDVRPLPDGFAAPHWHDGRVTGIKYRLFSGAKTSEPGSVFTESLYEQRLPRLTRTDTVIITEGESDAWAASWHVRHVWGVDVVGLPSGAQTWRRSWVETWRRELTVLLGFDNDQAGNKAYLDVLLDLTKAGFKRVSRLEHPEKDLAASLKAGWRPSL